MNNIENRGLEGLGNINTDNASPTVSTPYGYLSKVDTDTRKLVTDFSKFNDNNLADYLISWFNSLGILSHIATDQETDRVCDIPSVYTTIEINGMQTTYKIYCIKNPDDAIRFAGAQAVTVGIQSKVVLFGNYSAPKFSTLEKQLRQSNIEIFALDDIYDINASIDNADKGLPYIGAGTKLSVILAKMVNAKYKNKNANMMQSIGGTDEGLTGLGEAFKSGLDQLKGSISDAIGSIKGATGNSNIQNTGEDGNK